MAIVKFVSDKDCQVFIDMELVGKVASESMLKVKLEPGGYLIQIKDEEGKLIKEYDLEIKSSDNQLLQKIDGTNNKLDDTIENLKNDSSLVFHCDRASFCHNGLFGFVDKKLNVVISPIYYSVNEFVDNKAFVVRDFPEGRKTTMIDSDGNMFFNRWYDYIGESDDTILLGVENRIIVYSKKECDKVAEYFNANYDKRASLVPVYKKVGACNYYGYINFDGKEAIPFIFNNVRNFDERGEADVVFLGREVKINSTGYYQEKENGHYYKTSWNGDLQGLDGIFEFMPNPCSYDTEETSWHFVPIWDNYKWIFRVLIKKGNPQKVIKSVDYKCDYVLRGGTGYWVLKQEKKVVVLIACAYTDGIEELTFDADDVVPVLDINDILQGRNFVIRKDNKYGVYSAGKLSDFEYDNVTKYINSNNEYSGLLLEKAGKYGLWKNSSIIPPVYDCIDCYGDRCVVSINGLYGIIDDNAREILPINHEKIIPLGNEYFKEKNEKGWTLGYIHHGTIYPNTFDDIILLSDNKQWLELFLVKTGENYGCINNKGELILPIKYDKIMLDSSLYSPRVISILTYKDGKVGFCVISYFYSEKYCCKRTGNHDFEYIYYVEPQFEECVLQRISRSVLGNYYMHYAAVRKGGKWGILDQIPRDLTYFANDINLEDVNEPNWEDLNYKYNSLEELKEDTKDEFDRRVRKYLRPWTIINNSNGEDCIVQMR